ncbi:MAG: cytochrome c maturation protein CcmE [Acidobacteria bacterium]|nr:cytochrome c maturation protein CcmE [Acidobacteriota bacterium]
MGKGRIKLIVAGTIVIAAISYLMISGISQTTVYYYKLSELMAQPAASTEGVRVSGKVVPGSIRRDPATMSVEFTMAESNSRMPVRYTGIVPDTFKDDSEVVVEGKLNADRSAFRAHTLLAKCPSKYEGQYDTEVGRQHQEKYGIQSGPQEAKSRP